MSTGSFSNGIYKGKYLDVCQLVLERILNHTLLRDDPEMQGKEGFSAFACPIGNPQDHFWQIVGTISDTGLAQRTMEYAQEKALRGIQYPGLLTSYECRERSKKQYGGAIRGNFLWHSTSIFDEDLDEVASYARAICFGDLTFPQAQSRLERRSTLQGLILANGRSVEINPNKYGHILRGLI